MLRKITFLHRKSIHLINTKTISNSSKIDKILIANRGEIACRIIKTAKKLGIKSVAVFSDADKNSLHVKMADESYNIGPPESSKSYLNSNLIIEIAKKSKSKAIHPGYGFLSENAEFSETCESNNITFIGPPPSAIRNMGIKSTSKLIMTNANVPVINGYHGEDQSIENLKKQAKLIGYPLMIKAVRGGGGKGMRIALNENEFEEKLESAKTEAEKSFGDSVVLLENFIKQPRHIEVQVFGDKFGNYVHLFERDCSVQRRHQKIIEEAPAPGIDENLREKLGETAVKAAKAVNYVGAGTVEFIFNKENNKFYFMEMNTRLQVEHPITEMITGQDLVEWQIRVASNEKLPLKQNEIKLNGHSFETRIYAENPSDNFLPGAGNLKYLIPPKIEKNVRIETGVRQGDDVSIYYDPMIAKLVVWDENRLDALRKLKEKLLQYHIAGVETNINFLLELTNNENFKKGDVHTNFIKENESSLFPKKLIEEKEQIQAAISILLNEQQNYLNKAQTDKYNPFITETNFRINHKLERKLSLNYDNKEYNLKIKHINGNNYEITTLNDGNTKKINGELKGNLLETTIDNFKTKCNVYQYDDKIIIFNENGKTEFTLPILNVNEDTDQSSYTNKATSPMPGIIDKIFIKKGDIVKKDDNLFVLIAMKMEHIVKASRDAVIENVYHKIGDNVSKDTTIVKFTENSE